MEVLHLLSEANLALGELKGVGQRLPNPHLLIGPFLRREAVLSSRIEGTVATAEELLLFEAAPKETPRTPDVHEVSNYVKAMEHGLARRKDLPISLRLIKELHAVLMDGVRGEEKRPGEFRNRQNYIAAPGRPIEDARFVPPPASEMMAALSLLERYLHEKRPFPPLIELALIHYQFETIHPFLDGNGRIGRLMISLLLSEWDLLSQPMLYLSAFFEKNRKEYADGLLLVSQTGNWKSWTTFFLRGVAEQSRDAILRTRRLLGLWDSYRSKLQTKRSSALPLRLVDELFAYPAMTVNHARRALGIAYHSAQLNVMKLVRAGVLREYTKRRRNRIYVAPEIVSVIDSEQP
jgi:Fic family protein